MSSQHPTDSNDPGVDAVAPITPGAGGPEGIIHAYFRDVWRILTQPTQFFRTMPVTGGLAHPLAFALVTHWLGTAIAYLWSALLGSSMEGYFQQVWRLVGGMGDDIDQISRHAQWDEARNRMLSWLMGAGSVIIDPFSTLVSVLVTSSLVYVGARLFVGTRTRVNDLDPARDPVTFESAARIVCYGMTPAILATIPIFGKGIAWVATWVITVIGAREVYRVATGRAVVIALFPKLLILGLITLGIGLVVLLFFKLLMSAA